MQNKRNPSIVRDFSVIINFFSFLLAIIKLCISVVYSRPTVYDISFVLI